MRQYNKCARFETVSGGNCFKIVVRNGKTLQGFNFILLQKSFI